MAGQELSGISALSQELPVQIIDPSVHRLIEEGSTRRRRLMDWGVFHVKQEFVVPWRRYQRALMQRNAAVRTGGQIGETEPWSSELQQTAQVIDELRSRYVAELQPMFESVSMDLLGFPAELVYHRGWAADTTLGEALRSSAARESRLRTTVVGAHRADLEFRIEGRLARDRVSRGQQKMIAVAFVLAQIALKARTPGIAETCLLLDDPAAELDVDNLGKLLKLLEKVPAQLVITALHQDGLKGVPIGRVFHVEQGNFSSML
jgi:DNA replication and repair protein RecF